MALHLIPDDGAPHAPTSECGCDPQIRYVHVGPAGTGGSDRREAYVHTDQQVPEDRAAPPGPPDTGPVNILC